MLKTFLTCFVLTLATSSNAADELVIIGEVQSIQLHPVGTPSCPNLSGSQKLANGSTSIRISNDCGCQETKIKVSKTLMGNTAENELTVKARIGEWCKPSPPLERGAMLMQISGEQIHLTSLIKEADRTVFDPKAFDAIGGEKLGRLPVDGDGYVELNAFLSWLSQIKKRN